MKAPGSDIDPMDYPQGPSGMARYLEDRLEEIEAQKHDCQRRAERSSLNRRAHALRELLAWCKTRAGYISDI